MLLFGAAVAITDLVARLQSGPAGSVTPLDWLPVCFLLLAVVAAVAGVRADARGCPRLACCMTVLLFLGVFLILFLPDAYLATASARPSLIGSSSDIVYLLALLVYLAIAFIRGYELAS